MTRKNLVLTLSALLLAGFAGAAFLYQSLAPSEPVVQAPPPNSNLVRFHSPVIGPAKAPVTIVEFFDPSCESCRAFYPFVKQVLAEHPEDVRLVIRYTLFHQASEEASRLLEAARLQNLYQPVMEAILIAQPQWHDDPTAGKAWEAAEQVGLDVQKARADMHLDAIGALLTTDMKDVERLRIRGTPTFFVNGQPLREFSAEALRQQVREEVLKARN
ncbi:MAG: DsbA family protein [Pseudomonas sp.]|uniref:DsbA family protein n=1 Tax=Pseudomonas sp. TaxID=306 RepID=UPI003D0C61A1